MNRLIIIGNGFDLAHGIRTSYKDFIEDYISLVINSFFDKGSYSDDLIKIVFRRNGYNPYYQKPEKISPSQAFESLHYLIKSPNVLVTYNSNVLQNSLEKINQMNWVDLEMEYFNVLLSANDKAEKSDRIKDIIKVNDQLDYLKHKLIEYLHCQEKSFENNFDKQELIDCFTESIQPKEIVSVDITEPQKPENLYFLNFNYTKTFENYFHTCKNFIASEFNYIHGNLFNTNSNGNPIFGFGDEFDKKYLEFEEKNNNELFKHIKSFEYLKSSNYYRLIRFIESNDFQVHIYGHSCGLSDRTMLNEIFEHKNCKSIKIFYHQKEDQTNDYTEKTYEISRHFKDKALMRKKIVPFALSKSMPQPQHKIMKFNTVENQN